MDRINVLDPIYQQNLHALTGVMGSEPLALAAMMHGTHRQSLMQAYLDDFRLLALISICLLPLVWLLRKPPRGRTAAAPAH